MKLLLSALAEKLELSFSGDDVEIHGVNTLEKAGPHELSFLANKKYAKKLATTKAAVVLVDQNHAHEVCNETRALVSPQPYVDFARAVGLFYTPQGSFMGQSELAHVADDVKISSDCTIYPFVYIGSGVVIEQGAQIFSGCYIGENCTIGKGGVLYPNVTIMAGTTLGDNVIVQPGAVLGGDGFGFAPSATGLKKIPQVGTVTIGNDVEIGVNTAIDRAALDTTSVGQGSKIDNLVQVAHNVEIGCHSVVVSQVGISGSTKVGNGVTIAGQAGIAGHLDIGDGAVIGPKAGIALPVKPGAVVAGSPQMDKATFMRTLALIPKLPSMNQRLREMEREVALLKEQLSQGDKK